jgi:hypothetical protein
VEGDERCCATGLGLSSLLLAKESKTVKEKATWAITFKWGCPKSRIIRVNNAPNHLIQTSQGSW